MKTLQKYYTTPEQSKRLLELGVPKGSADCYLCKTLSFNDRMIWRVNVGKSMGIELELFSYRNGYELPCWSVGRLMEIIDICRREDVRVTFLMPSETINYIDYLIDILSCKWLDFSKLEE